jgi:hypothetical protein
MESFSVKAMDLTNGEQQSEAIPTGLHCSNYKAEGEAIIHAAHTIKCKVDNNTQVAIHVNKALSSSVKLYGR